MSASEVGEQEFLIYVGDVPPKPREKITTEQNVYDLGVSRVDQVNALLRSAEMQRNLRVTLADPFGLVGLQQKTLVQSQYSALTEGILTHPERIATLPTALSSGTRLVWLTTNGTVMALIVRDNQK